MTAPKMPDVIYHQGQTEQKYIHASVVEELVKALETIVRRSRYDVNWESDVVMKQRDADKIAFAVCTGWEKKK